jgi:hypothetical protein
VTFATLPTVVSPNVITEPWGNQVKANFDASPNALVTAAGDTVYAVGAGVFARLPIGAASTVMQPVGGVPSWVVSPTLAAAATLTWGGDTVLYRLAANQLATDDEFVAHTASGGGGAFATAIGSNVYASLLIVGNGTLNWGPGTATQDTNLYRSAAAVLKTDSQFESASDIVARRAAAAQAAIGGWGPAGQAGLMLGNALDAVVYRLGAGQIAADGEIIAHVAGAGSGGFATAIASDAFASLLIVGNGSLNWGPGNATQDTTLYRAGVNTLRTDSVFVASTIASGLVRSSAGTLSGGATVGPSDLAGGTYGISISGNAATATTATSATTATTATSASSATFATTAGGAPPTGAAGGSLSGSYPNPGLANLAVGTPQLANLAVTGAKLENIVTGTSAGDATHIPSLTMDSKGRVTALTTVPLTLDAATSYGCLNLTAGSSLLTPVLAINAGTASSSGFLRMPQGSVMTGKIGGTDRALLGTDGVSLYVADPALAAMRYYAGDIDVYVSSNVRYTFVDTAFSPTTDNHSNLGAPADRWGTVYAAVGTINTSNRSAKRLIRPLAPADALRLVEATPIYTFNYRTSDPVAKRSRKVGFMAEEAGRLLNQNGLGADPQTTASLALAAIQALLARVEHLEARLEAA